MELDHVFVMCDAEAPEASALTALGWREGSPNTHPGQGTACRRFFFGRSYLELLWVSDADVARHGGRAPARLLERWRHRRAGASPFGLVLRGREGPDEWRPTWPTWLYHPSYLPADQPIELAEDAPLDTPEIIALPWLRAPARAGREPQAAAHLSELLAVECVRTSTSPSTPAAATLHRSGIVQFAPGPSPLLTLRFANAPADTYDLRPALPLRLQW